MNKLNIILFFLICFSSIGQNEKSNLIGFNGLYETKCVYEEGDNKGTQGYLRFYSNRKVLSATIHCDVTVDDLKDWFNMKMEYLSVGDYEAKGRRIRFSTTSRNGTVNYRGRITKNGLLKLKSKSQINEYKSRKEYLFIKIFGLK